MKKTALFLFAAIAFIAFGAGTARADRGFWNMAPSGALSTYINVINMDTTTAQIATVTFYSSTGGTALGSTTATIGAGGRWNIAVSTDTATSNLGTPSNTTLGYTTAMVSGTVIITGPVTCAGSLTSGATTGAVNSCIRGYTTVATSGLSGFNFYFQSGANHPAE